METNPIPATGPERRGLSSRTTRALLFWAIMILLATALWKMAGMRSSPPAPAAHAISYSVFLNQAYNKKNIQAVTFYPGKYTTEVRGKFRDNGGEFSTTIPTYTLTSLTDNLRSQGATVEVHPESESDWKTEAEDALPFILVVLVWVFAMWRRTQRRTAGK